MIVSKRKKPTSSYFLPGLICIVGILAVLFVIAVYQYHSSLSETVTTKIFVDSRLNVFRKSQPEAPSAPPAPPAAPKASYMGSNGLFDARLVPADADYYRLNCPAGHLLSYWRPTAAADLAYRTPYGPARDQQAVKYVTFEPDVGGWNNIRMQMELVLVFALVTGRTLVLPPDQPMYLMQAGKGEQKAHSFMDFFPFERIQRRMPVISMEDFLAREGVTGHLHRNDSSLPLYPPGNKTAFLGMARDERLSLWAYLRQIAACPKWKSLEEFLIIPAHPSNRKSDGNSNLNHTETAFDFKLNFKRNVNFNINLTPALRAYAANRTGLVYDSYWQEQQVIHFISKPEWGYRLLEHFYTFLYFEDASVAAYAKRFVRDSVHYVREMMCKAAPIVQALLAEGNGSYVAFHIRRGEFQYKVVKIPAERMLANLKAVLPADQLVYIATDEKNASFFAAFQQHFTKTRFLSDFADQLVDVNPNYLGILDQIICMRGTTFVGTWFSTFSGYITRMRGYLGFKDKSVFYADLAHRDRFQQWEDPKFPFYMREFPTAWQDID